MGDTPPPLPPKLRAPLMKYSVEDQAKALAEEDLFLKKLNKDKIERSQSQKSASVKSLHRETKFQTRPHTPVDSQSSFGNIQIKQWPITNTRKNNDNSSINGNYVSINSQNEATDKDLISFISPVKYSDPVKENLLEKLQNLNKHQHTSLVKSNSNIPSLSTYYSIIPNNNVWNETSRAISCSSSSYGSASNEQMNHYQSAGPPPLPFRNPVTRFNSITTSIQNDPNMKVLSLKDNVKVLSLKDNVKVLSLKDHVKVLSKENVKVLSKENIKVPIKELSLKTISQSHAKKTSNLIDFGGDLVDTRPNPKKNLMLSVLDDFDPLSEKPKEMVLPAESNMPISNEAMELFKYKSMCQDDDDNQSYYEQVDPFLYMQATAASTRSDPLADIYDGICSPNWLNEETFDIPPAIPPKFSPKRESILGDHVRRRFSGKIKKTFNQDFNEKDGQRIIQLQKTSALQADEEALAFWNKIRCLRRDYIYSDYIGNPGLLHSPCLEGTIDKCLSVKLAIYYMNCEATQFTCNLTTSVEHVVLQSVVAFELEEDSCNYLLKVRGIDEYLCLDTQLGEYDYVHLCIKHDKDICFTLLHTDNAKRSYQRTAEDDDSVERVEICNLLTVGPKDAVHYDRLSIAVDAFQTEIIRLKDAGFQLLEGTPFHELVHPMRSYPTRHVIKQICALLGEFETVELTKAIDNLIKTCRTIQKSQGVLDGEKDSSGLNRMLCTGSGESTLPIDKLRTLLIESLQQMEVSLSAMLLMYIKAFRVDYTINLDDYADEPQDLADFRDKIKIEICGLHRLNQEWVFDEYFVEVSHSAGQCSHTQSFKVQEEYKMYPKVSFSEWVELGLRINLLPRESRYIFTVFGVKCLAADGKSDQPKYIREKLGWASIQAFTFDGFLNQGSYLLTLWPMSSHSYLGPAPHSNDHPYAHLCPILSVSLMDFEKEICFPVIEPLSPKLLNFGDLDTNTQQQLADIIERDIFTFHKSSVEEREILWEKRHYLYREPAALAKVLLAAQSWDFTSLPDLHSVILNWKPLPPADALHLLLPIFPDTVVRKTAVDWIRGLGSDELIVYLPQLVQAVKHEAWDVSKLTELLLERALTSPRLAHHLYWLLNQCMPIQTNMGGEREQFADARYRRRLNLVTRALMAIYGNNLETHLLRQEALLRSLYGIAMSIKNKKDSLRMLTLQKELRSLDATLQESPTALPLSPSLEVAGIDVESCSYYMSFTVPLRLAFSSSEPNSSPIHTIFKVGDDLRQDMLVIQMIRMMDKLWLRNGLDLKIVTFNIVPTGDKIGIIEMVKDAETLRKIQTENGGPTGSFQERPIAEWLAKQNPSQLEYHRAVKNFTASCAGYCVATYILGICDRHNDNIMLKTSGHLFHIDFGKFLGDAQKFGSFKRDRAPFVLTTDMAYVINGGDKASHEFQTFVDLCCRAFNIIRQNGHLLLYLFALMASSGIPGVTMDAVLYVEKALLQDKTNAEAGAYFAKMIEESLKSWFTQVNFFIHNLAQMRFTGESTEDDSLLSFVPHTFSFTDDGRIRKVRLYSYQKRYNPNKYYVYIIEVERENQKEPTYLFRSYREFSEFHQKLCCIYPLAKLHSLPKGLHIGRSEIKAVAEKRKIDIINFLDTLFLLADEICHSEIVYTFFHPLLRDQEDSDIHIRKLKNNPDSLRENSSSIQGQVKISLQYVRGQLQIVVQHARNLLQAAGDPEPSAYVKLYLLPDPNKKTKRKTKVVKRSCHPTYMEMITYRMSMDIIHQKVLEVSVWSEDVFSENAYLGVAYLKLNEISNKDEICRWLDLKGDIKLVRESISR